MCRKGPSTQTQEPGRAKHFTCRGGVELHELGAPGRALFGEVTEFSVELDGWEGRSQ